MRPSLLLSAILSLLIALPLRAEPHNLVLEDGSEIAIERIGSGAQRLLWLPSEYGGRNSAARHALAEGIAAQGFEVWLVDLHGSLFLTPGRNSLSEVPLETVSAIINEAQHGSERLFLFSYARGAALTLMGARQWRLDHPDAAPLGGALLLHPNLLAATPKAGEAADYLPIATQSNLPIYLLQPRSSAKYWYLQDLVARLESGGSAVFVQTLERVTDGFQVRDDATDYEREVRRRLPRTFAAAVRLLNDYNREPRAAVVESATASVEWKAGVSAGLAPFEGDPIPPALERRDTDGRQHQLADYRGQVVLVNFWATWCPPCVKEIPSMGRLRARLGSRGFTILGVDIGESREQVEAFLHKVPADFPVLLDPDGSLVESWQIRAFPTNFILDREGRIRYAYFGALEWDAPEVVELVESLL